MTRKFSIESMMMQQTPDALPTSDAREFLLDAVAVMDERAEQYDQDDGERSMSKTIEAFNAITGNTLIESDGWLIMLLLKQVRQWSKQTYHHDSALDAVAYSALLAESLRKEKE